MKLGLECNRRGELVTMLNNSAQLLMFVEIVFEEKNRAWLAKQ